MSSQSTSCSRHRLGYQCNCQYCQQSYLASMGSGFNASTKKAHGIHEREQRNLRSNVSSGQSAMDTAAQNQITPQLHPLDISNQVAAVAAQRRILVNHPYATTLDDDVPGPSVPSNLQQNIPHYTPTDTLSWQQNYRASHARYIPAHTNTGPNHATQASASQVGARSRWSAQATAGSNHPSSRR